jgi:hypothetical protein
VGGGVCVGVSECVKKAGRTTFSKKKLQKVGLVLMKEI